MILVAGMVIVGGIYLFQSGALQNLIPGGQEAEAAPDEASTEEQPPQEEAPPDQEQPEVQYQPVPYPVPVPMPYGGPPPGLSRRQVCSRYFGGSCASECRDHGWNSRICRQCVSYCGPPPPEWEPRPRHRPVYEPKPRPSCPPRHRFDWRLRKCVKEYGGPGPKPREECPRGERYNWIKKKCETVPQQPGKPEVPKPKLPTPMPDTPPSVAPKPTATTTPSESYYAGWY